MDCNGVRNFFLPMQKQKKDLLQNHTLLQTFCFCSKYYLTLSHLTLHLTSHLTSPHLTFPCLTSPYYTYLTFTFTCLNLIMLHLTNNFISDTTHYYEYFWKNIFQYYKIKHYFRLFVFVLIILLEPYNVTPYKLFYFRFFFSNLTILHITNSVLKIWLLFMTLHYYTLLWNIFEKYFSVLQNYTLLQTFCFCSKYFVWTLQYYTLQIIYFRFFFSNLTILHITFKFFLKIFFSITKLHITSDYLFLF